MIEASQERERARARFALLSTVGAAVAGAGIGVMLGRTLADIAWLVAAIGLVVHLIGMVGVRRVMSKSGYVPGRWENVGYFVCLLLIVALTIFAASRVVS